MTRQARRSSPRQITRTALIFLPLLRPCIMSEAVNLRMDSNTTQNDTICKVALCANANATQL